MTPERPSELPRTGRWPLRLGFILIIAAFSLSNLVSMYEMRSNQTKDQLIVEKMLASIELLSRLERDFDRKRLLIDAHIFEAPNNEMAGIERKIANIDADFAVAAGAYRAIAAETAEREIWDDVQAQRTALQLDLENVIRLSRQDRDVEARNAMRAIDKRFEEVDRAMEHLININHTEANYAVVELGALQRESRIFLGALTLSGIAFALFVAVGVSRLLSHRQDQMRRAAMLLEERNRDLDAFAGRVAHDLRGPLTTISLTASRLSERAQDEGTSAVLKRGVRQMEHLIQDLLTLSSIDAQLPSTLCETAQVASSVAEELNPQVKSAAGTIRVEVEPATVRCSPGLLRQVLWNLGENAIKYRRPDVQLEIEIQGHARGRVYEFIVSDNGSGMPLQEARQAFEPFFRGEHWRSMPGTGLGLSIVKRVIEASGGSVSIDSEPGRGTTFDINLPLGRAA
jgi:two-component system, OmpR family, sensor kinase